jgi:hypothetical protein
MNIYEFSPFNNEYLIFDIKLNENKNWVKETHIVEFNKTFQNTKKSFNLDGFSYDGLVYHKVDAKNLFIDDSFLEKIKRKLRYFSGIGTVDFGDGYVAGNFWLNDAIQRNYPQKIIKNINLKDDDILIFSDVDEIIYSEEKDKIIEYVKKYGIITVKLTFTSYFMNLKVKNWGGPPEYSYRVFIMTGERYKALNITLDMLRKAGERGRLMGLVYCPDEILGVHHSWLGDEHFIVNKINSYAHKEHKKYANIELIRKKIKSGESFIPGVELELINEPRYLGTVKNNIKKYKANIISNA